MIAASREMGLAWAKLVDSSSTNRIVAFLWVRPAYFRKPTQLGQPPYNTRIFVRRLFWGREEPQNAQKYKLLWCRLLLN